jgi:hypothetical protein
MRRRCHDGYANKYETLSQLSKLGITAVIDEWWDGPKLLAPKHLTLGLG